jgi:septal ring factor EnvC (AmiA/AmiB activator)
MHHTNLLKATIEQDSSLKMGLSATKKDIEELNKSAAIADKTLERKEKEIQTLNKSIDRLRKELDAKTELLSKNNPISVSGGRLRDLLKSEFVLEKLEQGGLDNWEWYGESYPSDDEINNYCG